MGGASSTLSATMAVGAVGEGGSRVAVADGAIDGDGLGVDDAVGVADGAIVAVTSSVGVIVGGGNAGAIPSGGSPPSRD